MKRIITTSILIAFFIPMIAQSYSYLGSFNSQGVPNYLEPISDVIPTQLLTTIAASLPENFPVPTYHPSYISTGASTNIFMQSSGDVWVTFVDEGAGYKNVLGYYSYPATNPPSTIPTNNNMKIIFPNVSKVNSGGGLVPGNKVYLGNFPAGTVISWFLIADGFKNGIVTNGNWRLFSNPAFNPESNPALKYHNVLLFDSFSNKIILGFEDIRRDNSGCDNDFNDAIFYVSSTPDTAIQTNNLNKTTNPSTNTSSGNEGGLESNGSLASLISKRYFKQQHEIQLNTKSNQTELAVEMLNKSGVLSQFIPTLDDINNRKFVSTPTDLLNVTNALDVLSVDFYDSLNNRLGVLLMTETEGKIYNHTKSICDRLKGAQLLNIDTKLIKDNEFITYTLKQFDGTLEYVTCFSMSDDDNLFTVYNQWLIGQYPSKNRYFNFQIWSNTPFMNQYMVEKTLEKISTSNSIFFDSTSKSIPIVYFKKGLVEQKKVSFELMNNSSFSNAELKFSYTKSEQSERETKTFQISLQPNELNKISVDFDGLFDADIQLALNGNVVDEMYLADGAWGIDYPQTSTELDNFTISNNSQTPTVEEFNVDRSAKVSAKIKDYITLYKMLKPSNRSIDLTEFNYLNFEIENSSDVWIRLNKKSINSWSKQFKCKLTAKGDKTKISVPIPLFKNELNETLVPDDLISISFTTTSNNKEKQETIISVDNVTFSKTPKNNLFNPSNSMSVYPNPIEQTQTLTLSYINVSNEDILVAIYALDGKKVYTETLESTKGLNISTINISTKLKPGIYLMNISNSDFVDNISITVR